MNRGVLNLLTDFLAALTLLFMIGTGYILRFPLPPATNRTHELWGLSRHEWGTIHSTASLALLAVLFVHLLLHWEWIFSMVRRRFTAIMATPKQRLISGLFTAAALMIAGGTFAWAAHAGVRKLKTPLHPLPDSEGAVPGLSNRLPAPRAVDFQRDVMPIFETSCIGCHGPEKQRANFRVDVRGDFFSPGNAKPLIVPGDSEASRLIAIVSGNVKNLKFAGVHILPEHEIAVLTAWINAGARWPETESSKRSPNEEIKP